MKIDWKKEISLPKFGRGGSSKPKASRKALNGPDMKLPKPLADLYADLRDNRLLPLVALLIVAIIAAPIVLSSSGGHEEVPEVGAIPTGGGSPSEAGFNVVPAATGLRDYKKRLAHREALNPFRQPHQAGPASSGSGGESTSAGSSEESGSSESGGESTSSNSSSSSSSGPTKEFTTIEVGGVTKEVPTSTVEKTTEEERGGGHEAKGGNEGGRHHEGGSTEGTGNESKPGTSEEKGETTTPGESGEPSKPQETSPPKESPAVVGYTIDAEVGFVPHSTEKAEIAPMTSLPNAKHPVVVYLGLSNDRKRALFLMTNEVTAYYGGHCALDKQACQLIEVKPGKGVTFAYGYGESRYKVHLKRIVPTLSR